MGLSKFAFVAGLAALGIGAQAAAPEVENVCLGQKGARLTISYDLMNAPAIVTFDVLTNASDVAEGGRVDPALLVTATGDCDGLVQPGANKQIVWAFKQQGFAYDTMKGVRVRVTAWATNAPPTYLAIDLRQSSPNAKRRHYYDAAEDVPGGVTNDLYKTTHLLMRRIPARGVEWVMGKDERDELCRRHLVLLSSDYYMAVYETTKGQWATVSGSALPSDAQLPIAQSYDNLRGANSSYPESLSVAAGSAIQLYRTVTGVTTLDLPTDAQWEFAARAGRTSRYYWGNNWGASGSVATNYANISSALVAVGTRRPNGFGLYDMLGNQSEWVLDWFSRYDNYWNTFKAASAAGDPVVDPVGVAKTQADGNYRITRGGKLNIGDDKTDCAFRNWYGPGDAYGYRLRCFAE